MIKKKIRYVLKFLLFTLTKIFNLIFNRTNLKILPALEINEQFNFEFSKKTRRYVFRKNSGKLGKIIFDSSLDGTGTDEFLKILNTLGDENVFVISHKQDALADKFRSTIKFEKIKNFSHIVE